jgi:hypothetical protein
MRLSYENVSGQAAPHPLPPNCTYVGINHRPGIVEIDISPLASSSYTSMPPGMCLQSHRTSLATHRDHLHSKYKQL